MDGLWKTVFLMLGLIALYLVLVYSGGAASILSSITNLVSTQTRTLQGR